MDLWDVGYGNWRWIHLTQDLDQCRASGSAARNGGAVQNQTSGFSDLSVIKLAIKCSAQQVLSFPTFRNT